MLPFGTGRVARLILNNIRNAILREDGKVRLREDGGYFKRES